MWLFYYRWNVVSSHIFVQVNWSAIIMSSDVTDEDSVLGTEVHYLVDERGGMFILYHLLV